MTGSFIHEILIEKGKSQIERERERKIDCQGQKNKTEPSRHADAKFSSHSRPHLASMLIMCAGPEFSFQLGD